MTVDQAVNAVLLGGGAAVLHVGVSALRRIRSGRQPLGTVEEVRGLAGTTATTAAIVLVALLALGERPVPASAPVIGGPLARLLIPACRLLHRHRRDQAIGPDARSATPVLLFGFGEAGQGLARDAP